MNRGDDPGAVPSARWMPPWTRDRGATGGNSKSSHLGPQGGPEHRSDEGVRVVAPALVHRMRPMVGTTERILRHTSLAATAKIRQRTEDRLRALATSRADIPQRLAEFEFEWDIERVLFLGASIMSLVGFVLAALFGPGWLAIPVAIVTFLFVHATHGWAPPLPVLRRLGLRTMREIDDERAALRAIEAGRASSDAA